MKLLYCYTSFLKAQDILWGFIESGIDIVWCDKENKEYAFGDDLEKEVLELEIKIKTEKCDGVLSWNYFDAVSIVCEKLGIPYISWIFDSPLLFVYSDTLRNSCNNLFIFDKELYKEILSKGAKCFYLPLAVNSTRLGALNITDEQISSFSEDVSFVGSLYTINLYNVAKCKYNTMMLEKHEKLFEKQYGDWHNNYLYTDVTDEDIDMMERLSPVDGISNYPYISKNNIYIGFFLARKMAEYERTRMLNELAQNFRVTLYNSNDDHSMLENVICKPEINYELETPIVYFSSKINLNITLRSIQTGLPMRVFDVMGVGGFLMSNYQQEFEELYTPDKEVVLYSSMDELIDKTRFYLKHDRERLTIAMNGYKRTLSEHTMKIRAVQMLNTVFGDNWMK